MILFEKYLQIEIKQMMLEMLILQETRLVMLNVCTYKIEVWTQSDMLHSLEIEGLFWMIPINCCLRRINYIPGIFLQTSKWKNQIDIMIIIAA